MCVLIHCATLLLNHRSGIQWCVFWFTVLCNCWIPLSGVQWCVFWFTVLHYCWISGVQRYWFWFTVLCTLLLNHLSGLQRYLFWFPVLCYCWIISVVFSDAGSDSPCYTTAESVVFSDTCSDSLCYTAAESPQWCSVIPILIHSAMLLLNHLSGVQWCVFWFTVLHCWWITSVVFSDTYSDSPCYTTAESVVFSDTGSDSLCYATAESSQWCSVMCVLIHCATLLLNHLSSVQRYRFWFTVLHYCWITSVVFSDACSDSPCYTTAESS